MREARLIMADLSASGLNAEQIALVMELSAAITEEAAPSPRKPANDEVSRMGSAQRRVAYTALVERDGEACQKCECHPSTIWRRMGLFNTETGAQYEKVWPTSNLEVDHRLPLWAGGDNGLDNLWLLCIECHKRKTSEEAGQRRRA